jgi:hypothetical protein
MPAYRAIAFAFKPMADIIAGKTLSSVGDFYL